MIIQFINIELIIHNSTQESEAFMPTAFVFYTKL